MTRKKIKEYFDISETSYFSLLKSSEKWKEFFLEKEAILSLILSIIAIIALYQVCGRTFGINKKCFNKCRSGINWIIRIYN